MLVIRDLGIYSNAAEVVDEFREFGFTIKDAISLFTVRGARRPLRLIIVILHKGEDANVLLVVTNLCAIKIKIGHIPHCHCFQRFRHSSDRTDNAVACVSCGQQHLTPTSNLTPGANNYCVN